MKYTLLAASFALFTTVPAFAQDQAPAPQSPRGMFMQACGDDIKNFCSSAQSRDDRRACVMANKDKFSDSCKTFMANHPMHQHDQAPNQMQGPSH